MNSMGTINLYDTSEFYDERTERSRTWNKENKSHAREKNKEWHAKSKESLHTNPKWSRCFTGREEYAWL